ncbi:ABC1-domain-containing protein [Hortaea werneckii]|nr:ABC1-domain-containing protein [Hortaea werneckii]
MFLERLIIRDDKHSAAKYLADYIISRIKTFAPTPAKPFVIGLPTGSSPEGIYKHLVAAHKRGDISFRNVITFNMDEYVGIPREHPESYHSFMYQHFFSHVDVDPANIHILNGNAADLEEECIAYEEKIKRAGGIELFLGGIGPDGHIAFNEPGSSLASRTRVKTLAYDTILANSRFFGNDLNKVPKMALTVGVQTVLEAREVVTIITGPHKALALQKCIEGGVNHMWTLSSLQLHPHAMIVVDEDATLELQVKTVKYFKSIEQVASSQGFGQSLPSEELILQKRDSVREKLDSPKHSPPSSASKNFFLSPSNDDAGPSRPITPELVPDSMHARVEEEEGAKGVPALDGLETKELPLGGSALLAALSPAAFVSIAEEDKKNGEDGGSGQTHEGAMLEMSRKELAEQVPERLRGSKKWRRMLWRILDTYLIEPVATGLRFLHLVFIFVPVIATVPVIWIGRKQADRDGERSGTLWWYGFLVNSMERAGAAFIKLGQWAASRTDIFPNELCAVMGALHSNAPAHSLDITKKTIEKAFERKFEDIFDEFQEKPLGVGAIAQVYKAKLKPDLAALDDDAVKYPKSLMERAHKTVDPLLKSTPARVPSNYVAIKVLHPKIERIVRRDLRIMGFFANVINAIPTMEWLSFPDEVQQFGEMMRLQLDMRIESANLTIFRKNFRNRTTAWFPYPYSQYTTRQVLVEEFATGVPLEHFLQNGGGVFQKEIADEGLHAFLHMLLIDNFIHADLHPGNIMVRFYKPQKMDVGKNMPTLSGRPKPDPNKSMDVTEEVVQRLRPYKGDKEKWAATLERLDKEGFRPQLIFIDTGLVTELNEVNRKNFLDLFKAVAEFDGYKAGHLMVERCRQPSAVIDNEVFALKMQHLVLGVKSRTFALGNIKIGDILNQVLGMVRGHHVRLEGDFVNVVLSILLLEGIGRTLDPDLDLFSGALPILRQLSAQGGAGMLRSGDLSMAKVWVGLEARKFLQASVESVEMCVKYDQLSPNI